MEKTKTNPKGAGRKPTDAPRQRTQISLSPDLMAKFKELGASRWLAMIIKNEIK